jgi:Leucine-rich repeat (LRR) protein
MPLTFCHPEFEEEVRKRLDIFDRDITEIDALSVSELDLTNFDFKIEDIETLFLFSNLISLSINIGEQDSSFWSHFPKLQDLYWCCWGSEINFDVFSNMKDLTSLMVSGGDYSGIKFKGLDSLIKLNHLEELVLHEFGSVDLEPLEVMSQLKRFSLLYTDSAQNIETIGKLCWLESLTLRGLYIDNLDFLDSLPDYMELELCGIEIYGRKELDVLKWKRFKKRDICEISIKAQYWEYVDLSALDE